MCGRFSLIAISSFLSDRFAVTIDKEVVPRYNIAPGTDIPVVLNESPDRLSFAHWGLIPHWAKEEKTSYTMINARAETLHEKPAYKMPFESMRCLIPADGFYEWKKTDGKIPFRFTLKDESVFSFAGIYDRWNHEGKHIVSCSIITTPANELMRPIHDRMPVMLSHSSEKQWLANTSPERLHKLLAPYPSEEMKAYQISTLVNSPKNDNADIIRPLKTLGDY
jgi:putative SOS response-associated peptidase YedK